MKLPSFSTAPVTYAVKKRILTREMLMPTLGYLFWTAVERRSLAAVSDRPEM